MRKRWARIEARGARRYERPVTVGMSEVRKSIMERKARNEAIREKRGERGEMREMRGERRQRKGERRDERAEKREEGGEKRDDMGKEGRGRRREERRDESTVQRDA